MVRKLTFVPIVLLLSIFFVPLVTAGDLATEYLYGRWAIDVENCSSPDSEYMVFRKNGTFENTRTGKAEIVGFWELNKDTVELHMVTSPAFFDDLHKELKKFEGTYNYFYSRIVIFNTKDKSFEAVGVIWNEMKKMNAVKCQ
jgi:hypothetical protein